MDFGFDTVAAATAVGEVRFVGSAALICIILPGRPTIRLTGGHDF